MSAEYLEQLPEGVTWPGFSEKDYSLIAEPLRVSASQREFRSWLCDITLEYFWTREFCATTGTPAQRTKDAKAIAKAARELSDLLDGQEKLALTIFEFADPDRRWMTPEELGEENGLPISLALKKLAKDAQSYAEAAAPDRRGNTVDFARRDAWRSLVWCYVKQTRRAPGRSLGSNPRASGPLVRLIKAWSNSVLQENSPGEASIEQYIKDIKWRIRGKGIEAILKGEF